MVNIQPFMIFKISCSLWLIFMYIYKALLSRRVPEEAKVPNSLHVWLASALTTCLPDRACVPRHLHGQLCCALNCTLLASSRRLLCQVSVLIIASSISSLKCHINAQKPPLTLGITPRQASSKDYYLHPPFFLFTY